MISYSLPFPPISWFLKALHAPDQTVYINHDDLFAKMSYRNRYYIAGAQGKAMLTIPLEKGRNQRTPLKFVKIDNSVPWQSTQWKTLLSNYKRTPYYEYLAPEIAHLYTRKYEYLYQFNQDALETVIKMMKLPLKVKFVEAEALPDSRVEDITRILKPQQPLDGVTVPEYWQVFQDRCGFIADLSILDYLFNEGIHL